MSSSAVRGSSGKLEARDRAMAPRSSERRSSGGLAGARRSGAAPRSITFAASALESAASCRAPLRSSGASSRGAAMTTSGSMP